MLRGGDYRVWQMQLCDLGLRHLPRQTKEERYASRDLGHRHRGGRVCAAGTEIVQTQAFSGRWGRRILSILGTTVFTAFGRCKMGIWRTLGLIVIKRCLDWGVCRLLSITTQHFRIGGSRTTHMSPFNFCNARGNQLVQRTCFECAHDTKTSDAISNYLFRIA
jgi:hypothetical protein